MHGTTHKEAVATVRTENKLEFDFSKGRRKIKQNLAGMASE